MNRVEEHHIITVSYELHEGSAHGELLERMDVNYPFTFLFGAGKLLPAFEGHLAGLAEGQRFAFTLTPVEAYGPVDPRNIADVPLTAFATAEGIPPNMLVEGNYIALTDTEGQVHNGRIMHWDDDKVRVDFNHAMAGKTLHFSGVVLHIRPATVEELIRGQYMAPDGVHNDFDHADDEW